MNPQQIMRGPPPPMPQPGWPGAPPSQPQNPGMYNGNSQLNQLPAQMSGMNLGPPPTGQMPMAPQGPPPTQFAPPPAFPKMGQPPTTQQPQQSFQNGPPVSHLNAVNNNVSQANGFTAPPTMGQPQMPPGPYGPPPGVPGQVQQTARPPSQAPTGQMPPHQSVSGQLPPNPALNLVPPSQMPLSQGPPGPPGQMPPLNQGPPGPPGQMPLNQGPPGQMPLNQGPPGPMPLNQGPPGQMPLNQGPPGQIPLNQGLPGVMASNQMPPVPNQGPHMPPQQFPGHQSSFQGAQQYPQPPQAGQRFPPGQGGYPGAPQMPQMPQVPQQRRLDPDQMPNPIQVMAENQRSCQGPFVTNQPGLVPPLVTTKFITHDQGNSGPRFVRSTMYSVPATTDMIKQTAVPFALIVSPFAKTLEGELTPPIVDLGELGPIRCIRCKAYMCPNMQFIDGGRRFQCLLCKATTEVPPEYFQHLDHTGQRMDKYERPELVLGTYEFVATKDYCRNNTPPKPPAMIFLIDVSYNNVKSGLVNLLCGEMKNIVKNLAKDQGHDRSYMKVGFITYNNTVHFYNCKASLAQPQMMIVGDVQEMFMPLLDGFLCDVEESSAVIDALMEQIPAMFGDTRETETILLPAIQAGMEALRASECAGKLLVFHSSLPTAEAPGKLKNRDARNLLATEKEKTVLTPQCTTYNNLGQECVQIGCSVDLFVFNNSYIDLATVGQVARLTGGQVYKYTYFQADLDGHRLIEDVVKNISRPIAFDTVMRVRSSTGIRPTDFYGHFFMSNTTDMEIASIDTDKSVAIEIKHDDKLPPEENVYIQVALLYTSCSGQRRLRVMNLCLKTCTQIADLYRSCDLDATILYFAKQGMAKLLENTPKLVKDNLINRCAQILACYRKNCASPASAGQLILPESMKLLPLYTSCLLKNDAFSGGSDMTVDDRSYVMQMVSAMDLPTSVAYFYPRLIPLHDVDPNGDDLPESMRCTAEKMMEDGAYILENGVYMFMWLGMGLSPEFTQGVFGVPSTQQIDAERSYLPTLDTPLSQRVRKIVEMIQEQKTRNMRLTIIRQRDKLESVMRHFLVEDRGTDGTASYVDFLCHLHKEIRTLLS
ncbi:protein transport protein Sec24C [Phlebotomus argentipes]|uniref:protein transport protein Sec24C n=1 Tax=Phlebotomus argentipes TaxID=94469 RepID=UPI002893206B|nr:protein transport protein Sec24C [Phlebotomus argentipes]